MGTTQSSKAKKMTSIQSIKVKSPTNCKSLTHEGKNCYKKIIYLIDNDRINCTKYCANEACEYFLGPLLASIPRQIRFFLIHENSAGKTESIDRSAEIINIVVGAPDIEYPMVLADFEKSFPWNLEQMENVRDTGAANWIQVIGKLKDSSWNWMARGSSDSASHFDLLARIFGEIKIGHRIFHKTLANEHEAIPLLCSFLSLFPHSYMTIVVSCPQELRENKLKFMIDQTYVGSIILGPMNDPFLDFKGWKGFYNSTTGRFYIDLNIPLY